MNISQKILCFIFEIRSTGFPLPYLSLHSWVGYPMGVTQITVRGWNSILTTHWVVCPVSTLSQCTINKIFSGYYSPKHSICPNKTKYVTCTITWTIYQLVVVIHFVSADVPGTSPRHYVSSSTEILLKGLKYPKNAQCWKITRTKLIWLSAVLPF